MSEPVAQRSMSWSSILRWQPVFSDAARMVKWVDATILDVDATHSRGECVACHAYARAGPGRIAGVVLNRAPARDHRTHCAECQSPTGVDEHPHRQENGAVRREQHGSVVAAAFPSGERENGNARGSSASGALTPPPSKQGTATYPPMWMTTTPTHIWPSHVCVGDCALCA